MHFGKLTTVTLKNSMKYKQVYLLATTLLSLFLLSIVLVSCSDDEEKPKPIDVSGIFTANVDPEADFRPDKIVYGPYQGATQIFATETSTRRGIEILFIRDMAPGTYTIDNSQQVPDLYAYFYGDVDVLLSREDPVTPGTFTIVKYDADSLVANFNFATEVTVRNVTEGVIKLKLK